MAHGTTTPLASIFGSGFLVIVSLLSDTAGPFALFAMAAICLVAYSVGTVVRHNIAHAEPALKAARPPRRLKFYERMIGSFAYYDAGVVAADAISASGNMLEITGHRIPVRMTYVLICGLAILLTWTANTFEILALASRAFAFYYFLQCLVAFEVT